MTEKTLALFGDREDVRELADRIRKMLPGGMNYTESEALTLAQMSVAHGLDPFNGEVWLIKDPESGKVYGALIGIKGQRRHAKQQSDYWGMGANGGFTRITDPKLLEQYGATGAGDIVYEYRIVDKTTITSYTKSLQEIIKLGFPLEDAVKMCGSAPVTIGIGIYKTGEKTKMKPSQAAMFRAEKDALKRRFDVKFTAQLPGQTIAARVNGDEDDPAHDEIEAEYSLLEDEPEPVDTDQILEELSYAPPAAKSQPAAIDIYAALPEPVRTMKNSKGTLYIDIPTEQLVHMANALDKALRNNGLSEDEKAEKSDKLEAAKAILDARK